MNESDGWMDQSDGWMDGWITFCSEVNVNDWRRLVMLDSDCSKADTTWALVDSCDERVLTLSLASFRSRRSFRISDACFSSCDEYSDDAVDTRLNDDP